MTMQKSGPITLKQIADDTDLGAARRKLSDEYVRAKRSDLGTGINKLSDYYGASYGIYPPITGRGWQPSNGEKYWNYWNEDFSGGGNGTSSVRFINGTGYPANITGASWRTGLGVDVQTRIAMGNTGNCLAEFNTRWFHEQGDNLDQRLQQNFRNVKTASAGSNDSVDLEVVGWSSGFRVGTPSILFFRKETSYNTNSTSTYNWIPQSAYKWGITTWRCAIRQGAGANALIARHIAWQRSYLN